MNPAELRELETLCEKEFELVRDDSYRDLDREVANIREHFGRSGKLMSSDMAQSVVDAVLARYDRVLAGFEDVYLGKWANKDTEFGESDQAWLQAKARSVLEAEASKAQLKCHSFLWEKSLSFVAHWQEVGPSARSRNSKIFKKIQILQLRKKGRQMPMPLPLVPREGASSFSPIWDLLHPAVVKVARARFEGGHYADAAESALKEVNDVVHKIVKERTGKEYDGADLMNRAFSVSKPVLKLADLATETGRNIQVGYMQIFAGAMTGIRNPKAHANLIIDPSRSTHFLFLASLLFSKIDETIE